MRKGAVWRSDAPQPSVDVTLTRHLVDGIGLCLSGGGYRATLFACGSLWRLAEMGLLAQVDCLSSVSGGSIANALLGLRWPALHTGADEPAARSQRFRELVADPLVDFCGQTIDIAAALATLTGGANRALARFYDRLFRGALLSALPQRPRFVFCSTNLQSGELWSTAPAEACDRLVGRVDRPDWSLAQVVAASSAFPPVLSPAVFRLPRGQVVGLRDSQLTYPPYTTRVQLTDGGVFDNLGLEPIEEYCTKLVVDAGGRMPPQPHVLAFWPFQFLRVFFMTDNQVRQLRKASLVEWMEATGPRGGAYWSIRSEKYHRREGAALPCSPRAIAELATVATRLKRWPERLRKRLVNWGYAACDAVARRYWQPAQELDPPDDFPYPEAPV